MTASDMVYIGKSEKDEVLDPRLANRHGLITGATGTGKTVTLQVMAEGLSRLGIPVFAADVKGDFSGVSQMGVPNPVFEARAAQIGLDDYKHEQFPIMFWDLYGEAGHPIRASMKSMGPLIVSRLLDLNDVQEGIINIVFRVSDDENIPLIDLDDLRAVLNNVSNRAEEISAKYGNVAKASVGAVQRSLLVLEQQGGKNFFGEPALDINDFMKKDAQGRGYINVLMADKLMQSPRLYATFLLWLMNELFTKLPEAGDLPKPKLCFFFDEAHLLFDQAPPSLMEKIEQVTRLIRSKAVGVYYVTQNPLDVPDTVSGQLGNRVQHALRAFTPREQKAVRAAAETFRPNPKIDTARVIMELAVGEALVSMLEGKGTPEMVERTLIRPPSGRVGAITDAERNAVLAESPLLGKYEQRAQSRSAADVLAKGSGGQPAAGSAPVEAGAATSGGGWFGWGSKAATPPSPPGAPYGKPASRSGNYGGNRQSTVEIVEKAAARGAVQIATRVVGQMIRRALGGR